MIIFAHPLTLHLLDIVKCLDRVWGSEHACQTTVRKTGERSLMNTQPFCQKQDLCVCLLFMLLLLFFYYQCVMRYLTPAKLYWNSNLWTTIRGIEWTLRAFASMRVVRLFLRARALINFLMRAASTLEITNGNGEQRAHRKFSTGWNLSLLKRCFAPSNLADTFKTGQKVQS